MGSEVGVPLGRLSSLALGDLVQRDVLVGILDTSDFPAELDQIGGLLSLAFFAEHSAAP